MDRSKVGKRSKEKGNAYERQIAHELNDLYGVDSFETTRANSKKLDADKIDIFDPENISPCYFQLKKTQNTPSVKKINAGCHHKDKPLCILWNIQEKKEGNVNFTSGGQYAIIPKDFLYKLLKIASKYDE